MCTHVVFNFVVCTHVVCTHVVFTHVVCTYVVCLHVVIRDFSSPQCQPNQTYCTAGESLLTWCAGLWARAQACHWNRQKKETTWSNGFEA